MFTLAHRFFIDPMDVHALWWLTLLPIALFISMAYKAIRLPTMDRYWPQVASMAVQIVLAMIGLAAACYVIIELFVARMSE
jgi:membrane protein YdbS with pleckstrin-like domain